MDSKTSLNKDEQIRILRAEKHAMQETIDELQTELELFAYAASHDLRSPLSLISGFSQLIGRAKEDHLSDESKEYLSYILANIARIDSLLHDLLRYSRAGRTDYAVEPVSVDSIVSEQILELSQIYAMEVEQPQDLPTLQTVRVPLEIIFQELLTNAIQHQDQASSGETANWIKITWSKDEERYEFCIEDGGPGIAPEDHAPIFQLFKTLKSKRTDQNGTGLALVKKLLVRYGGEIQVESALGKKSRFIFTWPETLQNERPLSSKDALHTSSA